MIQLRSGSRKLTRMAELPQLLVTVGILARIEANRVKSDTVDVSLLADEISALALRIKSYTELVVEKTKTVEGLVTAILQETERAEGQRDEQRNSLVNHAQAVLDPLRARVDISRSTACNIDRKYAGIRGAIDKVVMSLQVQDIARQRIEHVQESLAKLEAHPEAHPELVPGSGAVLAVQRSQIVATRDLLSASIVAIVSSSSSLRELIAEVMSDTAALASQTAQDGGSFVAQSTTGSELSVRCSPATPSHRARRSVHSKR